MIAYALVRLSTFLQPTARRRRSIRRFAPIAASLCGVVLTAALWIITIPRFGDGTYTMDREPPVRFTLPLRLENSKGQIEIRLPLRLASLHPRVFSFLADDCLQGLTVNDGEVTNLRLPFCDYARTFTVDLSEQLRAGDNTLTIRISNAGGAGSLLIQPARSDPLTLLLGLLLIGTATATATLLLRLYGKVRTDRALVAVFTAGCILQFFYVLGTPYTIRGHDTDGHIEYIRHVAANFSLPSVNGGWEFWQPPLYYVLSASWYRIGDLLSWNEATVLFGVQMQSWMLTALMLACAAWIGVRSFPLRSQWEERLLFLSVVAVLPGLVFLSARVNNDVLVHALGFLFLAQLVRSWQRSWLAFPWYLLAVTAAAAVLTKSNGHLLLPIALITLVFRTEVRWQQRVIHGLLAILIVMSAMAFVVARANAGSTRQLVVGNIGTLNSGLRLQNTFKNYATFDPVGILAHPYNNPWKDEERRQYFWEYVFRSAFSGEWGFGERLHLLSLWILGVAMLLLPTGILGFCDVLLRGWRRHLPLLATAVVIAGGHAAFRWISPYGSSQDFRYSTLLILPAAFFILHGIALLPRTIGWVWKVLVQAAIILCAVFLLSL